MFDYFERVHFIMTQRCQDNQNTVLAFNAKACVRTARLHAKPMHVAIWLENVMSFHLGKDALPTVAAAVCSPGKARASSFMLVFC